MGKLKTDQSICRFLSRFLLLNEIQFRKERLTSIGGGPDEFMLQIREYTLQDHESHLILTMNPTRKLN